MKNDDLYFQAYSALRERVVNVMSDLEEVLEEIDMLLGSDSIMEAQYQLVQRKIMDSYMSQAYDEAVNVVGEKKLAQLLTSIKEQDID